MIRSRCQRILLIACGLVFCTWPVFAAQTANPGTATKPPLSVSDVSSQLKLHADGHEQGDIVRISGSGFSPGETVSILVLHRDEAGNSIELDQFGSQAGADGTVEAIWELGDPTYPWQSITISATGAGSGRSATARLVEVGSKITIVSFPSQVVQDSAFEVTVRLEEDCCDSCFSPLPGRTVEFYIHEEECGIPIGGTPVAMAVTDENGLATATMTTSLVGHFTFGVKYFGEDQPGENDPPNSACYPGLRVKILASIDCTYFDIINHPVQISCPPSEEGELFICLGDTVCVQTNLQHQGAGGLAYSLGPDSPGMIDPETGVVCLIPVEPGAYQVEVIATDSIGQTDRCTVFFDITINGAPSVELPPDMTIYPCYPREICVPVELFDVDDNILNIATNLGVYDNGQVCVTIDEPGVLTLSVDVTDACGLTSSSTMQITADPGPTPFVELGEDLERFLCQPSEICVPIETISGYGSLTTNLGYIEGGQVCFMPELDGAYELVVMVTDTCGQSASDTVTVNVTFNQSPTISLGVDVTVYPCYPRDVCIPIGLFDGDGNIESVISNMGVVGEGNVCLTIDEPGSYDVIVEVTDVCGEAAVDTVTITADPGVDPWVTLPADLDTLLCGAETICVDVTTIAGYGSLSTNLGAYNEQTGQVCFTPFEDGFYSLIVQVTDTCGLMAADTMQIIVAMNKAPTVSAVSDTSFYICYPQAICLPVSVNDADNNIAEVTTSQGYYDNGLVCFTPYSAGNYDIVITVTDECGESASTTINLTIMTDQDIAIECPNDTTLAVCVRDTVCIPLSGIPQSEYITVDVWGLNAWYDPSTQSVCFYTECSNQSNIEIMVTTPCSTYSCDFAVTVECNVDPLVLLPPDTSMFLCGPGEVCIPVGVSDANNNLAGVTSEGGVYDAATGRVCFSADTSGVYRIVVTALDECGADDSDEVFVTVGFNQAPVCEVPNDTSMFQCQDTPVMLPVTASDADGNLVGCQVVDGPGAIVDGYWTYTPTTDETAFVTVACTDDCGESCQASFAVTFEMNQPPVAIVRESDHPILVCDLDNAEVDGAISDPDGNLADGWYMINGVRYDFHIIVQFPALAGPNEIILYAVDSCGLQTTFQTIIEFYENTPPVCEGPTDTTIFICGPTEVCLPIIASDVDNNLFSYEHVSGPGELRAGLWCYQATTDETVTVTVRRLDACNEYCEITFSVTFEVNEAPIVACPDFIDPIFACDLSEVCLDGFQVSDPDGNLADVIAVVNGVPSELIDGQLCFQPVEGENTIVVTATDACGEQSVCPTSVMIALNSAPTCNVPNDTSIFLCDPTEVRLPVSADDADGNLTGCVIKSGPGQIVDGNWVYAPSADETVTVTILCTDDCGATCESSFTVDFDLNSPPAVACGDFFEPMFVCNLDEICLSAFGAIDEDNNLVSVTVEVNGQVYPVIEGSICFIPVEGRNDFVLTAIDACGDTSRCDAVLEVILNSEPVCLMPNDTTLFNCGPQELCLPLAADDPDGNLSGWELIDGPGSIENGQWCYTPDGTETVTVIARATDDCGAYCDQTFKVTFQLNKPPTADCPADTTIWSCDLNEICISGFGVDDPEGEIASVIVTVNGDPVEMIDGTVCFMPVDGSNLIVVTVVDACGEEVFCKTEVIANLNEAPICNVPNDTTVNLCAPEQICLPVSADDPNSNFSYCEVIAGPGEIVDGNWCYTANRGVGEVVTVRCYDSCGAYCDAEFTVVIEMNEAPKVNDVYYSAGFCVPEPRDVLVVASDADGDPLTYALLSGPGTINSQTGVITYTPDTAGVYVFEVAAYDTCAGDTGFVYDSISINTPPELVTFDSTIYLCNIREICFEVQGVDVDGDILNITQESGPGSFTMLTDSTGRTCFMPEDVDSATYIFEYCVTDPCTGDKIFSEACPQCPPCEPDTVRITVLRDRPPVVECPEPQQFSICEPTTLCFDFDPGDPELIVTILSQNATFDAGQVCFDAVGSDQFDIDIEVVDNCDHADTCIVPVTIEGNHAPSVSSAEDFGIFLLCEPTEVCFDVSISDVDGDDLTIVVNYGAYDSATGQVCFNADTAGDYMIITSASDSCGATASDTTLVTIMAMNTPPHVELGADFEIGLCGLTEVCVDVLLGDDNGNIVDVIPSLGSYNPSTGKVCFEVDHDGEYELIVQVTDECGASDADTVLITVTSGAPPFVDLGDDLEFGQCDPQEVCVDVNTIEAYQSLVTTLGAYNEATSQVCFTPDGAGEYIMIVTVVDSCDLTASDTVIINIGGNNAPIATGMPDTTVYLCYPQAICLPVEIDDPDGNIESITVNRGQYANGQVCFTPYDSGTFDIIVTVTDSCGLMDADTAFVTILTDQGIVLDCPNDTSIFTCVGDTFCLPIGGIPEIATVTVTGINTWFDDELQSICFYSECGNTNQVTVEVETPCGTFSCSFTVVIECNHAPLVLLPPDSSIMFCGPSEVCVPVGVYDPDGNLENITVEGGSYDAAHGRVCFTADTAGVYDVIVTAVDECGVHDADTMAVMVEFNTAPYIIYDWADSVISTCSPEICVPITFGDAEGNLAEVLTDIGYYNDVTGEICFTAESSGQYCIEVIAVDECGLADTLSACVTVDIGDFVLITCPQDTLASEPICGPTQVCVPLGIIGINFVVTPSIGTWEDGELCFPADSAGIYEVTVIGSAECNSDTCTVHVEVTIPDEAWIVCPADTALLACGPDTICLDFTVSESASMVSVTEPAYLDGNKVCVPVLEAGALEITMIATSTCNSDTCTFTVTSEFNSTPAIVSGPDTTLTVCEPYEVCIPFAVSDDDDNIIEISTTHGQIVGDQVCYLPPDFGVYYIVLSVRDECGATDLDTTMLTIRPGGSPLIVCPTTPVYDTLCAADSICITMPISPANAVVTIWPNGSYNPQTGEVCIWITESGHYDVTVTAEAECGVDTCEFDLNVQVPLPPVVICPEAVDTLLCLTEPVSLCYPVTVTGTDVEISVSPEGAYANGEVCVTVDEPGLFEITVVATGRCSADTCVTLVNVTADEAPQLFLPQETLVFERCLDDTTVICIDGIYATDLEDGVTLTQTCGPGELELLTADSGRVCFLPDAFGLYEFCFEVDDGCNVTSGSFFVDVLQLEDCDVCVRVSIDGGSCTPVGLQKNVHLNIESREWLGGFDILLAYDASVMSFTYATTDGSVVEGWEYFEYRLGAADCGSSCPSGLVRLVGIADVNNGPNHPPHESLYPNGILVEMQYQVANDQNLGDQFLPINFAWYSCADNAFSDTSGNDLFVDVRILNPEGGMIWDENDDIGYPEPSRPFGLGTRDNCFGGGKVDPIRCVEFINGGICVIHPDSIDDRGDINLNGVPYEIADAVVFSNYFIKGLVVFNVNLAGQIAATDVNADGVTLSVADLVLLIRVIIGDADPIPKLSPYPDNLIVSTGFSEGRLDVSTEATSDVGAALFVFDINDVVSVDPPLLAGDADGMDLIYSVVDGELRVLIYNFGTSRIKAGHNRLIEIPFAGEAAPVLKREEIVDYQGRPYRTVNKPGELPTSYSLSQNYPNPFNPATTISFSVPQATDWSIRIFNIAGKLVRTFKGHAPAGHQTVTWDGLDSGGGVAASGVYFYRLDAGSFTDTKKMVLLK